MVANPDEFTRRDLEGALPGAEIRDLLLELWPGEAVVLTSELRVAWLNGAYASRLHVSAHEAIAQHWFELNDGARRWELHYRRALAGESVEVTEPVDDDGERARLRRVMLRPLRFADGSSGIAAFEQEQFEAPPAADLGARRLAQIRRIAAGSRDLVTLVDSDGRTVFSSEHLRDITGFDPATSVGHDALQWVHPDDLADVRQIFERGDAANRTPRMRRLRFRHRHADGSWRWLESLCVNALADPLVGLIVIYSHDVTREMALEQQLHDRDGYLAALTERSQDFILALDPAGRVAFATASVERVFGASVRSGGAAALLQLVHPRQRRAALQMSRELLANHGCERRLELMVREPSAGYRWLDIMAVDLLEDRQVGGILINARDITKRKIAELERDAALGDAAVQIWEQDLATREIRWLSAPGRSGLASQLQRMHSEAQWREALHPDDREYVLGAYARFERDTLAPLDISYRLRSASGDWRHLIERALFTGSDPDSGGLVVRGVVIDVTDRFRMERELSASHERLDLALNCAQIGFYDWDVLLDVTSGLDQWSSLLGLGPVGAPGHRARWNALIHPEDMPGIDTSFAEHARGEAAFAEAEYRLRDGRGAWVWILDRAQIVARLPNGQPARVVGICMNIDRRKRTELALGSTQARLSTAVWGAQLGLWELDVATMRARWFSDWCESEDLLPCEGPNHIEQWDARIHPEDVEGAAAKFSDMLENRHDAYESEYRVQTRAGSWLWILERSRAVERRADGRPTRVVGICVNIHDRKQAEIELRRSQLRLQSIADNSPDWLFLIDAQRRIVFINRDVAGMQREALVGEPVEAVIPQHDHERLRGFFDEVFAGREHNELEQVIDPQAANPRSLLIRAAPVRVSGRVVGAVISATEITELRRQQQMLRLQGRILETMREGVVLCDADERIRLTNPAFDRMFGYDSGDLIGQPIEPLLRLDERLRRAVTADAGDPNSAQRVEPVELECARSDGTTLTISLVAMPMLIDGRYHWLAVVSDISDRRILEREILEVANREQHRIGNDLHDGLGQQLTGVALMLRGLAARIRRDNPAAETDVDDIVALVNSSIASTRTLARGLSPVSLERGGLIPALRLLAAGARESYAIPVSLRTRSRRPLLVDESAANHLFRIVQEALSNAARHGRASRIVIQLTVDENTIRLSVHDNGRGLPAGGPPATGLGLRTMRYRAQVLGGSLSVERHRLGGTIVRCVVPHRARDAQALEHARQRAHERAHPPKHSV